MNQFDPEDYIMLSALQHYAYCPRQFALIHIEQVWDENLYTLLDMNQRVLARTVTIVLEGTN